MYTLNLNTALKCRYWFGFWQTQPLLGVCHDLRGVYGSVGLMRTLLCCLANINSTQAPDIARKISFLFYSFTVCYDTVDIRKRLRPCSLG